MTARHRIRMESIASPLATVDAVGETGTGVKA
jgi:hypothetical protein